MYRLLGTLAVIVGQCAEAGAAVDPAEADRTRRSKRRALNGTVVRVSHNPVYVVVEDRSGQEHGFDARNGELQIRNRRAHPSAVLPGDAVTFYQDAQPLKRHAPGQTARVANHQPVVRTAFQAGRRIAVLPFVSSPEITAGTQQTAAALAVKSLQSQRFTVTSPKEVLRAAGSLSLDVHAQDTWKAADYQRLSRALAVEYLVRGTLTARTEWNEEQFPRPAGDGNPTHETVNIQYVVAEAHLRVYDVTAGAWSSQDARHTDREIVGRVGDTSRLPRMIHIACRDATRRALRQVMSEKRSPVQAGEQSHSGI